MHDAGRVGPRKRVSDANRDSEDFRRLESRPDQLMQALADYELHHDHVDAIECLDLVNGDDVLVVERGGGARFLNEPTTADVVSYPIASKDFDRDLTAKACIAGAIHLPHAAGA